MLAVEIRGAGALQPDAEFQDVSPRGSLAEFLKKWAAGDKARCPALT